jgi:predicted Zn-dependent peptidase
MDWNAYTSYDRVTFYWNGLDRKIEELLPYFTKIIGHIPTQEEFDIEKKIVMQEYADTFNQQNCVYSNITRKYYGDFGPIGWREDVENFTYEQMVEYIKTYYSKPCSLVRIGKKFEQPIEFDTKVPKVLKNKPAVKHLEYFGKFENPLIADWINVSDIDTRLVNLYNGVFTHGLTSPLLKEIRETRGLAYSCGLYKFGSEKNRLLTFSTSSKSPELVRQAFKEVISDYEKHITLQRFELLKESILCAVETEEIENYKSANMYTDMDTRVSSKFLNGLTYEEFMKTVKVISERFLKDIHYATYGDEMVI